MVGTLRIRSSDGLRLSRPALLEEVARILRFGLAGLANTAISIGVILLLERLCGLDPFVANAGGVAVGLIVSVVLHRPFVFRAPRVGAPVRRYARMARCLRSARPAAACVSSRPRGCRAGAGPRRPRAGRRRA